MKPCIFLVSTVLGLSRREAVEVRLLLLVGKMILSINSSVAGEGQSVSCRDLACAWYSSAGKVGSSTKVLCVVGGF